MEREDLLICAGKTKDRVNVAKVVSLFRPNKFKYHHEHGSEIKTTLDLPVKKRCRSRLRMQGLRGRNNLSDPGQLYASHSLARDRHANRAPSMSSTGEQRHEHWFYLIAGRVF